MRMSLSIRPTKTTFKKVESEYYNYHKTLKEIARLREEIMNPFDEDPIDQTIIAGSNSVRSTGNPTDKIASRLLTHKQLNYLLEITEAIEKVYNALPDDYKKLVRVKYWNKDKDLKWDGIALECNIGRATAFRRRDEIIQATIEVLGWR
jgi:RinA family phage transcriptional activator